MLEGIRRYQYSWQVQVPFAILAIVMAFWGFGAGLFNTVHPIATVNGRQILGDQVDREATQIRETVQQMYGANAQAVLKSINLRKEAVDRLIEQQLIGEEARHLGISISDEALQDKITKEPVFQRDGQFDFDTYQDVLRNANLLPAEYENDERDSMIAETLRNMIDSGVQVSDDEARHAYNLANEKIGVRYVEFAFSDFSGENFADRKSDRRLLQTELGPVSRARAHQAVLHPLRASRAGRQVHAPRQGRRGLLQTQRQHALQASRPGSRAAHPDFGARRRDRQGESGGEGQGARRAQAGAGERRRLHKAGGKIFGRSGQQGSGRRSRHVRARTNDQAVRGRGVRDEAGSDHDSRNALRLSYRPARGVDPGAYRHAGPGEAENPGRPAHAGRSEARARGGAGGPDCRARRRQDRGPGEEARHRRGRNAAVCAG